MQAQMLAMHRAEERFSKVRERYVLAVRDDGQAEHAAVLAQDDEREVRVACALRKAVAKLGPGPLRAALARVPGARAMAPAPGGLLIDGEPVALAEPQVVLAFYYWAHPGRIPGEDWLQQYQEADRRLGARFL